MMKSHIADAVLMPAAFGICGTDPEPRLAIGPADRVRVLVGYLETQEREQATVELLGFFVIADSDRQMIDSNHAHHEVLHCLFRDMSQGSRRRLPIRVM